MSFTRTLSNTIFFSSAFATSPFRLSRNHLPLRSSVIPEEIIDGYFCLFVAHDELELRRRFCLQTAGHFYRVTALYFVNRDLRPGKLNFVYLRQSSPKNFMSWKVYKNKRTRKNVSMSKVKYRLINYFSNHYQLIIREMYPQHFTKIIFLITSDDYAKVIFTPNLRSVVKPLASNLRILFKIDQINTFLIVCF